jgi:hypothetical protein
MSSYPTHCTFNMTMKLYHSIQTKSCRHRTVTVCDTRNLSESDSESVAAQRPSLVTRSRTRSMTCSNYGMAMLLMALSMYCLVLICSPITDFYHDGFVSATVTSFNDMAWTVTTPLPSGTQADAVADAGFGTDISIDGQPDSGTTYVVSGLSMSGFETRLSVKVDDPDNMDTSGSFGFILGITDAADTANAVIDSKPHIRIVFHQRNEGLGLIMTIVWYYQSPSGTNHKLDLYVQPHATAWLPAGTTFTISSSPASIVVTRTGAAAAILYRHQFDADGLPDTGFPVHGFGVFTQNIGTPIIFQVDHQRDNSWEVVPLQPAGFDNVLYTNMPWSKTESPDTNRVVLGYHEYAKHLRDNSNIVLSGSQLDIDGDNDGNFYDIVSELPMSGVEATVEFDVTNLDTTSSIGIVLGITAATDVHSKAHLRLALERKEDVGRVTVTWFQYSTNGELRSYLLSSTEWSSDFIFEKAMGSISVDCTSENLSASFQPRPNGPTISISETAAHHRQLQNLFSEFPVSGFGVFTLDTHYLVRFYLFHLFSGASGAWNRKPIQPLPISLSVPDMAWSRDNPSIAALSSFTDPSDGSAGSKITISGTGQEGDTTYVFGGRELAHGFKTSVSFSYDNAPNANNNWFDQVAVFGLVLGRNDSNLEDGQPYVRLEWVGHKQDRNSEFILMWYRYDVSTSTFEQYQIHRSELSNKIRWPLKSTSYFDIECTPTRLVITIRSFDGSPDGSYTIDERIWDHLPQQAFFTHFPTSHFGVYAHDLHYQNAIFKVLHTTVSDSGRGWYELDADPTSVATTSGIETWVLLKTVQAKLKSSVTQVPTEGMYDFTTDNAPAFLLRPSGFFDRLDGFFQPPISAAALDVEFDFSAGPGPESSVAYTDDDIVGATIGLTEETLQGTADAGFIMLYWKRTLQNTGGLNSAVGFNIYHVRGRMLPGDSVSSDSVFFNVGDYLPDSDEFPHINATLLASDESLLYTKVNSKTFHFDHIHIIAVPGRLVVDVTGESNSHKTFDIDISGLDLYAGFGVFGSNQHGALAIQNILSRKVTSDVLASLSPPVSYGSPLAADTLEPCYSDDGCINGQCSSDTKTCKGKLNAACPHTHQCLAPLECNFNQCTQPIGSSCSFDEQVCGFPLACHPTTKTCVVKPCSIGAEQVSVPVIGDDAMAELWTRSVWGDPQTCVCNPAEGAIARNGACARCLRSSDCGEGGTCVGLSQLSSTLTMCKCAEGYVKNDSGQCTLPQTPNECRHGTISNLGDGCLCNDGYEHNSLLGGCQSCAEGFISRKGGPSVPKGRCKLNTNCKLGSLRDGCTRLYDSGETSITDVDRHITLESESSVTNIMQDIIAISGRVKLTIRLDNDDDSVFELNAAEEVDIVILGSGRAVSSSEPVQWSFPELTNVRSISFKDTHISTLPATAFPKLEEIETLIVDRSDSLKRVSFSSLRLVSKRVSIVRCPLLEQLSLPQVSFIERLDLHTGMLQKLELTSLLPKLTATNHFVTTLISAQASFEFWSEMRRIAPVITSLPKLWLRVSGATALSFDTTAAATERSLADTLRRVVVRQCDDLRILYMPYFVDADSEESNSVTRLYVLDNPKLELVYDRNSAPGATSRGSFSVEEVTIAQSPQLKHVLTCAAIGAVTVDDQSTLCCHSAQMLANGNTHNSTGCDSSCVLQVSCNPSTRRLQPVQCTSIVPLLGELSCSEYSGSNALEFNRSNPLEGDNLAFMQQLRQVATANIAIEDSVHTGALVLPNLEHIGGSFSLRRTRFTSVTLPGLSSASSADTIFRATENTELFSLSLEKLCELKALRLIDNKNLVFSGASMCRDGSVSLSSGYVLDGNPESVTSVAAFIAKFGSPSNSSESVLSGNGGCSEPQIGCRHLYAPESHIVATEATDAVLQFLNDVVTMEVASLTLSGLQRVPSLPLLQQFRGGDLRINNTQASILVGFAPSLFSIHGRFSLTSNTQLKSMVSSLESLHSIGGLEISDNAVLNNRLDGLRALNEISGDVIISNNAVLQSLAGLGFLRRAVRKPYVTSLVVENNDRLTSLAGLDNIVVKADGVVLVRANAKLIDISSITADTRGIVSILDNPILLDIRPARDLLPTPSQQTGNGACLFLEPGCKVYQGAQLKINSSTLDVDVASLTTIEADVEYDDALVLPELKYVVGDIIAKTSRGIVFDFPKLISVSGSIFVIGSNPEQAQIATVADEAADDGSNNGVGRIQVTNSAVFTDGTTTVGRDIIVTADNVAFLQAEVFNGATRLSCSIQFDARVSGGFDIVAAPALTNVDGSIQLIGPFTDSNLAASNTDLLDTIQTISGSLVLSSTNLTSFPAFPQLTSIGESLFVSGNAQLLNGGSGNMEGLEILTGVSVRGNAVLQSLDFLSNLRSSNASISDRRVVLADMLELHGNPELTDVSTLLNIASVGEQLRITDNHKLGDWSSVDSILRSGILSNTSVFVSGNGECSTAMPGCSKYNGNDVTIELARYSIEADADYYKTVPLPGFWNSIRRFKASLTIIGESVDAMNILFPPLPNLRSIRGSLTFMNCVSTEQCFSAFASRAIFIVGDVIIENSPITSMTGFDKVTRIEGNLVVRNTSILSTSMFAQVESIGGDVVFEDNSNLAALGEFRSLNTVAGDLKAINNNVLRNSTLHPTLPNSIVIQGEIELTGGLCCNRLHASVVNCEVYQGPRHFIRITQTANRPVFTSLQVYESNLTFVGSLDLPPMPNLQRITGFLSISGAGLRVRRPFAPKLVHIGLYLVIRDTVSLSAFPATSFQSLQSVGFVLGIRRNRNLQSLSFPSLQRIENSLDIRDNHALQTLQGFQSLSYIGNSLMVESNSQLQTLQGLDTVTHFGSGSLIISSNPSLTTLVHAPGPTADILLPEGTLQSGIIVEDLIITDNTALVDLGTPLSRLRHVDGSVIISGNTALPVIGLPLVRLEIVAKDMIIAGNSGITTLAGLHSLQQVGGKMDISNNAALQSLHGLQMLWRLGTFDPDALNADSQSLQTVLEVSNNAMLADVSALVRRQSGTVSTIRALGSVKVHSNPTLQSLSGIFTSAVPLSIDATSQEIATTSSSMQVLGNIDVYANAVCRQIEPGCRHFEGDSLVFDSTTAVDASAFWSSLETMLGTLQVRFPELTSAHLPTLREVSALELTGGVLSCTGCFPALVTIHDRLEVTSNAELSEIDDASFANLTKVGNSIRIYNNPQLTNARGILNRIPYLEIQEQQPQLLVSGNQFECFSLLEIEGCQMLLSVGDEPFLFDSSEVEDSAWHTLVYISASVVFESQASPPSAFAAPTASELLQISGTVSFGAGVTQTGLVSLRRVGTIEVRANSQLTSLNSMAQLQHIYGSLQLAIPDGMGLAVTAPLEHVGESVIIEAQAAPSLTHVSFSQLKNIYGSLIVRNGATIQSIELAKLERVQAVSLSSLSSLTSVGVPSNATLAGSLSIIECTALSSAAPLFDIVPARVLGDLVLQDNDKISSLDRLSHVEYVRGALTISTTGVSELTSLQGLENLQSVLDGVRLSGESLSNLEPLSGLRSIGSVLEISQTSVAELPAGFAPELTGDNLNVSFIGNAKLVRIKSPDAPPITIASDASVSLLRVADNPALSNLHGLPEFRSVVDLEVVNNVALSTLDGLQNLTHIDVTARIVDNSNLVHLRALLDNFDVSSYVRLIFDGNKPCASPIAGCEVFISDEALVVNPIDESSIEPGFWATVREIHADVTVEGPSASFGVPVPTAPNLERIEGKLTVVSGIGDLSGFSALIAVTGDVVVSGNDMLASLTPWTNLTQIGGGITLEGNSMLSTVQGFAPSTIAGDIVVTSNDILSELGSLLTHLKDNIVSSSIEISNNPSLLSLDGMLTIDTIVGNLVVRNNLALDNLGGLHSLQALSSRHIEIVENRALSDVTPFNWKLVANSFEESTVIFSDNAACLVPLTGCKTLLPRPASEARIKLDHELADFVEAGLRYQTARQVRPREKFQFPQSAAVLTSQSPWTCSSESGVATINIDNDQPSCVRGCDEEAAEVAAFVAGQSVCLLPCEGDGTVSPDDATLCIDNAALSPSHLQQDKAEFWGSVETIQIDVIVPSTYTGNFNAPQLRRIEGDLDFEAGVNIVPTEDNLLDDWSVFPALEEVTGRVVVRHHTDGELDLGKLFPKLSRASSFELLENNVGQQPLDLSRVNGGNIVLNSLLIRDTDVLKLFTVSPAGSAMDAVSIAGAPSLTSVEPLSAIGQVKNLLAIHHTGVRSLAPLSKITCMSDHPCSIVVHNNVDLATMGDMLSNQPLSQATNAIVYQAGITTCAGFSAGCVVMHGAPDGSSVSANSSDAKLVAQTADTLVAALRQSTAINCGGANVHVSAPTFGVSGGFEGLFASDSISGSLFEPIPLNVAEDTGANIGTTISTDVVASSLPSAALEELGAIYETARSSIEPLLYKMPVAASFTYTVCALTRETDESIVLEAQRRFNLTVTSNGDGSNDATNSAHVTVDPFSLGGGQVGVAGMVCTETITAASGILTVELSPIAGDESGVILPILISGIVAHHQAPVPKIMLDALIEAPVFGKLRESFMSLDFNVASLSAVEEEQPDTAAAANDGDRVDHGPKFPVLEVARGITLHDSCKNARPHTIDFRALRLVDELELSVFMRGEFSHFNALEQAREIRTLLSTPVLSPDAADDGLQLDSMDVFAGFDSLSLVTGKLVIGTSSCSRAVSTSSNFYRNFEQMTAFAKLRTVGGSLTVGNGQGFTALQSLRSLDGFGSVQSIGRLRLGASTPDLSLEGFSALTNVRKSVSAVDRLSVVGLGQLATTAPTAFESLLSPDNVRSLPSLACADPLLEGQPRWNARPSADGNGVSMSFHDNAKDEQGYLFAVQRRSNLLGGATPSLPTEGCSGDIIQSPLFSWLDIANALGRDLVIGEKLKMMVYAVGTAVVDDGISEVQLGLEAGAIVTVPFIGRLSVSVATATEDITENNESPTSVDTGGGVEGAQIRLCWAADINGECTPIQPNTNFVTSQTGLVNINPEKLSMDVTVLMERSQPFFHLFVTATMPDTRSESGERLLHCGSSKSTSTPLHVACVQQVSLPESLSLNSLTQVSMSFADPESLIVQGRVNVQGTRGSTSDGISCPSVGVQIQVLGKLASSGEINDTSSADGSFSLLLSSIAAGSGDYATGVLLISAEGHSFAIGTSASTSGAEGIADDSVLQLSRDAFVSFLSTADGNDDKQDLVLLRLLPPVPGKEHELRVAFRIKRSMRGVLPINIIDVTPYRPVVVFAQQGLCTDALRPLSANRPTTFAFVGGNDADSWCPTFRHEWDLTPGRVRAALPLPPIPLFATVDLAPTAQQQAYFDFLGTQRLSLHNISTAPWSTSWVFRSIPQIRVQVSDGQSSAISPAPQACMDVGVLEENQELFVINSAAAPDVKHNVELEVTVEEFYDDVACNVVPGSFSMINFLSGASDSVSSGESTVTATSDPDSDEEQAAQDCVFYISNKEVVPVGAACDDVEVAQQWPITVKLLADLPASDSQSSTNPLDFTYSLGVQLFFRAFDAQLKQSSGGIRAVPTEPRVRTPVQTATYNVRNVLVQGIVPVSRFESVLLPHSHPLLFLYKPPGDHSYSEIRSGTSFESMVEVAIATSSGVHTDEEMKGGFSGEHSVCAGLGVSTCNDIIEFEAYLLWVLNEDTQSDTSSNRHSVTISSSFEEHIRTGLEKFPADGADSPSGFMAGTGDMDVFVGIGTTVVFEQNNVVAFDSGDCTVSVTPQTELNDIPDEANTIEVQQIFDIKYTLIPQLETNELSLAQEVIDAQGDAQKEAEIKLKAVRTALDDWRAILDDHWKRREAASQMSQTSREENFWSGRFGVQTLQSLRSAQAKLELQPHLSAAAIRTHTGDAQLTAPGADDSSESDSTIARSKVIDMVSFSGGGLAIDLTYHSQATGTDSEEAVSSSESKVGGAIGGEVSSPATLLETAFKTYRVTSSTSAVLSAGNRGTSVDVHVSLSDEDPGDYFDVHVLSDPRTGLPMFQTVSGRSMCPYEASTTQRESVRILNPQIQLTEVDPTDLEVSFPIEVVNNGRTGETFAYVMELIVSSNPNGLQVFYESDPLHEQGVNVELIANIPTTLWCTVRRPLREEDRFYSFKDIKLRFRSMCDHTNPFQPIASISVDYLKPCPPIEWVGPMTREWVKEADGFEDSSIAFSESDMVIAPPNGLLLTLRNPSWQFVTWSKASHLHTVAVQYRQLTSREWLTIDDTLKDQPSSWGEIVVRDAWPNPFADVPLDAGVYELRAICKCIAGSVPRNLQYSVTETRRVLVGNETDPLATLQADLLRTRTDLQQRLQAVRDELQQVQADVQADIHSVQTDVQSVQADVQSVQTDVQSVQADVQTVSTKVDQVESGLVSVNETVLANFTAQFDLVDNSIISLGQSVDQSSACNTRFVCGIQENINSLNATLEEVSEGACLLTELDEAAANSSSSQGGQVNDQTAPISSPRRKITCDANNVPGCCGDGMRQNAELCDTGSEPDSPSNAGCIQCVVVPGWSCVGAVGQLSVCTQLEGDTPVRIGFAPPDPDGGGNNNDSEPSVGPSISIADAEVNVNTAFPSDMLPSGEYVDVSLQEVSGPLPPNFVGSQILRVEPSVTPQFQSAPIVFRLQLPKTLENGTCDSTMRLQLFDTVLQMWTDAAKTCTGDRYLHELNIDACVLTTNVCHLTDFAVFSVPEDGNQGDGNNGSIPDRRSLTLRFAPIALSLVVLVLVAGLIVLCHRRRANSSKERIAMRLNDLNSVADSVPERELSIELGNMRGLKPSSSSAQVGSIIDAASAYSINDASESGLGGVGVESECTQFVHSDSCIGSGPDSGADALHATCSNSNSILSQADVDSEDVVDEELAEDEV